MPILLFSCSYTSKPIYVQKAKIHASRNEFETSLKTATENLQMSVNKNDNSEYLITKMPDNSWDNAVRIRMNIKEEKKIINIESIGTKYIPNGNGDFLSANEFAYMVNDAIEQEIFFRKGESKYNKKLPEKKWPTFLLMDIINPGLGVYYGYNTPLSEDKAIRGGILFGAIDLFYIAFLNMNFDESDIKTKISPEVIGWSGIIGFRLLMAIAFGVDQKYYRKIQKSPYYFDLKNVDEKTVIQLNYTF